MPIYEYRCSSCGHELEALQKFSDAPLSACPSCHNSTLVKLLSAAGFQLKGSGWYATDFKGSGKPKPAKTDDTSKSETKTTSESTPAGDVKGEAAVAPKQETKSESKSSSVAPAAKTGSPPAAS